jgi:hypothetical protein
MRLTLVNTVSDSSAAATAAPLACVWLWPLQASRNEKRGRETRVGASQAGRQTDRQGLLFSAIWEEEEEEEEVEEGKCI